MKSKICLLCISILFGCGGKTKYKSIAANPSSTLPTSTLEKTNTENDSLSGSNTNTNTNSNTNTTTPNNVTPSAPQGTPLVSLTRDRNASGPSPIVFGMGAYITGTFQDVNNCKLTNDKNSTELIVSTPFQVQHTGYITATTIFTLKCQNSLGQEVASSVAIEVAPPTSISSMTGTYPTLPIVKGSRVTLLANIYNTGVCSLSSNTSSWSAQVTQQNTSAIESPILFSNTTFTLDCTVLGGLPNISSVTVYVQ